MRYTIPQPKAATSTLPYRLTSEFCPPPRFRVNSTHPKMGAQEAATFLHLCNQATMGAKHQSLCLAVSLMEWENGRSA
jgi:hypothetical protein